MALSGQVIYLIRLDLLHDSDQIGRIGHIAIVHKKMDIPFMGVFIKMIHSGRVKRGGPPLYPMNLVPFLEKIFCKIGPILSRYTGDQCLSIHKIALQCY